MDNEEKKGSEKFSAFMKKAAEVTKKTADTVAQGAKDFSEKIKEDQAERERLKKEKEKESLNPLFAKEYKKKDFHLPEVIVIADDSEHAELLDGAMGWRINAKGTEILYLYRSWIVKSGLEFSPAPTLGDIYCAERFNPLHFVRAEEVFRRAHDERLAELDKIAYALGACSYSIEIVEAEALAQTQQGNAGIKIGKFGAKVSAAEGSAQENKRSGKTTAKLAGHNEPTRPVLKWFKDDENIKNLIEMRCSDKNSLKTKTLELKGASMISLKNSVACAIDTIKKISTSVSMESEATKAHNSTLIFEIEF